MQNYFNYFTEIEEHFQRRRGSLLMLSTLDWALIESWREASVPLPAVLRGIAEPPDDRMEHPVKQVFVCFIEDAALVSEDLLGAFGYAPDVGEYTDQLVSSNVVDRSVLRLRRHFELVFVQIFQGSSSYSIRTGS